MCMLLFSSFLFLLLLSYQGQKLRALEHLGMKDAMMFPLEEEVKVAAAGGAERQAF